MPVIRTELMLAVGDSLITAKNAKKEGVNLLIDNADYQICFAKELGYGKRDKEFEELML